MSEPLIGEIPDCRPASRAQYDGRAEPLDTIDAIGRDERGGDLAAAFRQDAGETKRPQAIKRRRYVNAGFVGVDRLDARFAVDKGVFRTQSVEAVSGERALRANGSISLPDRNLDMQLAVGDVAKPAADGQDTGKTAVQLQPREIINVRGPWAAPDLRTGPPIDKALQYGPPNPG